MKRLILCLTLVLASFTAQASLTVNQVIQLHAAAASVTVSISIPSGHSVAVWTYGKGGGATIGTVTDSASNTYILGTAGTSSNFTTGTAYSLAIASAITSVTYTPPGTATDSSVIVWDVTATGTIVFGGSNANVYSFNSVTTTDGVSTNSIPVSSTDALLLAGMVDASGALVGSLTAGTGFTSDTSVADYQGEHKAVTASAPATFTDTSGTGHFVLAAGLAFQVGGGGGSCTHNFWSTTGAFSQPNGTSGSYWSIAGSFATPNCTSGSFWRQDGTWAAN